MVARENVANLKGGAAEKLGPRELAVNAPARPELFKNSSVSLPINRKLQRTIAPACVAHCVSVCRAFAQPEMIFTIKPDWLLQHALL